MSGIIRSSEYEQERQEIAAQRDAEWVAAVDEMLEKANLIYPNGNAFGVVLRGFTKELKSRMVTK